MLLRRCEKNNDVDEAETQVFPLRAQSKELSMRSNVAAHYRDLNA